MEAKIPVFYIRIYQQLKEINKPEMPVEDFINILKGYRIDKEYINLIMFEFEKLELIERRGKGHNIVVLKPVKVPNLQENKSKFYHYIGVW